MRGYFVLDKIIILDHKKLLYKQIQRHFINKYKDSLYFSEMSTMILVDDV